MHHLQLRPAVDVRWFAAVACCLPQQSTAPLSAYVVSAHARVCCSCIACSLLLLLPGMLLVSVIDSGTCAMCLSSATPWYICKWLLWFAALERSCTALGVFGKQGKLLLLPAVVCLTSELPWITSSPLLLASLLISHWTVSLLKIFCAAMSLPAALSLLWSSLDTNVCQLSISWQR